MLNLTNIIQLIEGDSASKIKACAIDILYKLFDQPGNDIKSTVINFARTLKSAVVNTSK